MLSKLLFSTSRTSKRESVGPRTFANILQTTKALLTKGTDIFQSIKLLLLKLFNFINASGFWQWFAVQIPNSGFSCFRFRSA